MGVLLVLFCTYRIIDHHYNDIEDPEGSLFIWGDSQAYHGIDMELMHQLTHKKIFTAAQYGAGMYDFLIFAEKVPSKSEVIVALSKPTLIRGILMDRNKASISLSALITLLSNNYSISHTFTILKNNLTPSRVFSQDTQMYPYSDTLVFTEPTSLFENFYNTAPNHFADKQEIMLTAVKTLKQKNCKISFVEFPYHPIVQEIEHQSEIKVKTEQFKNEILNLFEETVIDTLYLNDEIEIMYDLTHLNETGASTLTQELVESMNTQEHTTLYISNWRQEF